MEKTVLNLETGSIGTSMGPAGRGFQEVAISNLFVQIVGI